MIDKILTYLNGEKKLIDANLATQAIAIESGVRKLITPVNSSKVIVYPTPKVISYLEATSLFLDTFKDTDSTSIYNHTPEKVPAGGSSSYSDTTGYKGEITSNELFELDSSGDNIAVIELGANDNIKTTLIFNRNGFNSTRFHMGLYARTSSDPRQNGITGLLDTDREYLEFDDTVNGSSTYPENRITGVTIGSDPQTLVLEVSGNDFTIKYNGFQTSINTSSNQGNTHIGLKMFGQGTTKGKVSIDAFYVQPLAY